MCKIFRQFLTLMVALFLSSQLLYTEKIWAEKIWRGNNPEPIFQRPEPSQELIDSFLRQNRKQHPNSAYYVDGSSDRVLSVNKVPQIVDSKPNPEPKVPSSIYKHTPVKNPKSTQIILPYNMQEENIEVFK